MEKFNKLNEDLLVDETSQELIDLMKNVAKDLIEMLQKFKAIAKAKGIRFNLAAQKKDAIEAKILAKAKASNHSKADSLHLFEHGTPGNVGDGILTTERDLSQDQVGTRRSEPVHVDTMNYSKSSED